MSLEIVASGGLVAVDCAEGEREAGWGTVARAPPLSNGSFWHSTDPLAVPSPSPLSGAKRTSGAKPDLDV